jgi:hypothetical protein
VTDTATDCVEASLEGGGYRLVSVAVRDERVIPRARSLNSVLVGSLFLQTHSAVLANSLDRPAEFGPSHLKWLLP